MKLDITKFKQQFFRNASDDWFYFVDRIIFTTEINGLPAEISFECSYVIYYDNEENHLITSYIIYQIQKPNLLRSRDIYHNLFEVEKFDGNYIKNFKIWGNFHRNKDANEILDEKNFSLSEYRDIILKANQENITQKQSKKEFQEQKLAKKKEEEHQLKIAREKKKIEELGLEIKIDPPSGTLEDLFELNVNELKKLNSKEIRQLLTDKISTGFMGMVPRKEKQRIEYVEIHKSDGTLYYLDNFKSDSLHKFEEGLGKWRLVGDEICYNYYDKYGELEEEMCSISIYTNNHKDYYFYYEWGDDSYFYAKAIFLTNRNIEPTGLSLSEEDALKSQIFRCWSIPLGMPYNENLVVKIKLEFNQDGTIKKSVILDSDRMNEDGQNFYKVLAESVLRAIRLCQPLRVPTTGYERWKVLILNFDPRDMLEG